MRTQLKAVRSLMQQTGLDMYYIGSEDCHNSEYVNDYYKLREYISGFTGSAGSLLITMQEAILWTDGRYFLQAEEQLKDSGFTLFRMGQEGVPGITEYIGENLHSGMVFGYDALVVPAEREKELLRNIMDKITSSEIEIRKDVTIAAQVWEENGIRPKLEFQPIKLWDTTYAGENACDKITRLARYVKKMGADGYVVASLDEIAWLCNLRGSDVPCNPVFFSYAIWYQDVLTLYCSLENLEEKAYENAIQNNIVLKEYQEFYDDLQKIPGVILADESCINVKIRDIICSKNKKWKTVSSPILHWKAVKNKVEIQGEQACHIEDAAAMITFLFWLKRVCHFNKNGILEDENGEIVTELSAAKRLEQERARRKHYVGPSFEPIIAVGEHGAIIHYSATKETSVPFSKNTFVLMDTGGQYLEGTTDVTRTIVLGEVKKDWKKLYTAVLCGNLKLQNAILKKGCRGENIDILARESLWRLGYDFNHGTGHGVGCYLNVHEPPVSIRSQIKQTSNLSEVLEPGMIMSNEPGVYIDGAFGIRLENMMVCQEKQKTAFGTFYGFSPLTMVPWDRDAIATEYMSKQEIDLLNEYHKQVADWMCPHLDETVSKWLVEITEELN